MSARTPAAGARRAIAAGLRETPLGDAVRGVRNAAEGAAAAVCAPLLRRRRRMGAALVMYHGVTPELVDPLVEIHHVAAPLFRRQIRHLMRNYRVVSLSALLDRLESGAPVPDDWAVLTFDDGYRNNLTCAREILREEGDPPWSIFVTTDFVGSRRGHANILALMAAVHGRSDALRIPLPDGGWETRPARSRRERVNLYWGMRPLLKWGPESQVRARTDEFLAQFGDGEVEEIRARFPSYDWLSWDEVRELHRDGVDVCSHTRTHASLGAELPEERMRDEIFGSRARLEKELGAAPAHFAYPTGSRADFCTLSGRLLRDAGYRCGITTVPGTARAGADPFALPRLPHCVDRMPRFVLANAGVGT